MSSSYLISRGLASSYSVGTWQLLLAEELREPTVHGLAAWRGLTKRETKTLYWVGESKTNPEIGTILRIDAGRLKTISGAIVR